jgi:hypothetical protein
VTNASHAATLATFAYNQGLQMHEIKEYNEVRME